MNYEQPNFTQISNILDKYQLQQKEAKYDYEYQEVCSDLQKDFGKLVWTLPYKSWVTEYKLRKAGEIARQRGVKKFPYLVGIIKRLPY